MPKPSARAGTSMTSPRKILPRGHVMSDDPSLPFRTYSHHVPASSSGAFRSHGPGHMDDSMHAAKMRSSRGDLPRSVKHAPPELRAAIRRKQNNEASKRSRDKQRAEMEMMEQKYNENENRLKRLEKQVEELSAELSTKKDHRRGDFYGAPF